MQGAQGDDIGHAGPRDRGEGPRRVAVVIACRDDRTTIASTVRACRAIPGVDLIVVVDDGSDDDTGQVARAASAAVVRHSVPRGRSSALETGAKVVAMRDRADWPARSILFLDADLGDSAVEASVLAEAVTSGVADCAIGSPVSEGTQILKRRMGRAAARYIWAQTGWPSSNPLATNRCLTREALDAIMPFSAGSAVDVAMTLDLLAQGFSVVEMACAFEHHPNPGKPRGAVWRPNPSDVWLTLQKRRLAPGSRFSWRRRGRPFRRRPAE